MSNLLLKISIFSPQNVKVIAQNVNGLFLSNKLLRNFQWNAIFRFGLVACGSVDVYVDHDFTLQFIKQEMVPAHVLFYYGRGIPQSKKQG